MSNSKTENKDFDSTYKRFQSQQIDYEIKMKILREAKQEAEMKENTATPRINKNSENLVKNKGSFLERQECFAKKKQDNTLKLKAKKKKDEEAKLNQNPYSSFKTNIIKPKTKVKQDLNNTISTFNAHDSKKTKQTNSIKKKPKTKVDIENAIERLYRDDVVKRKENQTLLKEMYTPSFKPKINKLKDKSKLNRTVDEINLNKQHIKEDEDEIADDSNYNGNDYNEDDNDDFNNEECDTNDVESLIRNNTVSLDDYMTQQNAVQVQSALRQKFFKKKVKPQMKLDFGTKTFDEIVLIPIEAKTERDEPEENEVKPVSPLKDQLNNTMKNSIIKKKKINHVNKNSVSFSSTMKNGSGNKTGKLKKKI